MTKAASHKRQHFIPKSYLSAWCDPASPDEFEPYVWCYSRDGGGLKKKSLKKLFTENNMYTIEVPGSLGERDLRIEKSLSQMEAAFVDIRDRYLIPRKPLPRIIRLKLVAFFSALHARTPAARRNVIAQWSPVLAAMDNLAAGMKQMKPEDKARMPKSILGVEGPSMSHDDVRFLVENPLQGSIGPMVAAVTNSIFKLKMNICILCTSEKHEFITSDKPCTWHDPQAHLRRPMNRQIALMYKSVELAMPVSPHRLLLISHMNLHPYLDVPDYVVDEINRRTRFFCDTTFVSRSALLPEWLRDDEFAEPDIDPA